MQEASSPLLTLVLDNCVNNHNECILGAIKNQGMLCFVTIAVQFGIAGNIMVMMPTIQNCEV